MYCINKYVLTAFLIWTTCLFAKERGSSAPYISGDSFRVYCNFTFDELGKKMDPKAVKEGNTVFVKTDYLGEYFSKIHPLIENHYILITHNADSPIPGDYSHMLEDDKLIAWFGQNLENFSHPKIHPIPIGIANRCWKHGDIEVVAKIQKQIGTFDRNTILYMNFRANTYFKERNMLFNKFKKMPYCYSVPIKSFSEYLLDMMKSRFVLSPRGNGLDCHRTWEALLMGAIPIVRSSTLDFMFEELPVLIVDDWDEIDLPFLEEKYIEMQNTNYNYEKMYIDYWYKLIDSYKN